MGSSLGRLGPKPGPPHWLLPHLSSLEEGGALQGHCQVPVPSARDNWSRAGVPGVRPDPQAARTTGRPGPLGAGGAEGPRSPAHLTPILQSITQGESKSASKSSIWL